MNDPSAIFLELFQPLKEEANAELAFIRMLITPGALQKEPDFNSNMFGFVCERLGTEMCFEMLNNIQKESSDKVKGEICVYLAEQDGHCSFEDCPRALWFINPNSPIAQSQEIRRKRGIEEILGDAAITRVLNSKEQGKIDGLRERLQLNSCNRNPSIRKRSAALLKKYFLAYGPMTCVACR